MSVTANLTTNVETITATIAVEDETIIAQVSAAARGPAGPAGPAIINAATQSDGTADLDLLNVETVTATVIGTLTADHIHGNLAGSVYAHIRAGEALAKGDPVYVSGSHGSGSTLIPIVSKADASNAAKMPAVGIMDAAVANNANGHMVIVGTITQLNTAGYTVNAELYVAAGGGMTATPPTARAQPVARVERVNANNGAVIVKVNGLSASDATGNTLVRRTATGGAAFGALTTGPLSATAISSDTNSITSSAGTTITGPLTLSGTGSNALSATYSNTISLTGTTGVTIAGGTLTLNSSGFAYGAGAAAAHRTALGLGTGDSPTFAGLNAVGNGVTTTTLGADGRQSWFLNNSGVAAGQIAYSSPGGEPGITIIRGTGRSDIRAVAGMGIAIASYSSGSGAPAEQFRFSLTGNMLVGTTSETGLTNGGLRTSGNAIIGGTLSVTGASTFGGLIEQRNGTAAQESRIYGTYADGSNYRRLALKMSTAGVAEIVAEGLGSGSTGNKLQIEGLTVGKGGGAISTNTALGVAALNANTTGTDNAAVGYQSLISNTTGSRNSASGASSLFANTTGSDNTALGTFALFTNVSSSENTALGSRALQVNTGGFNTAVGVSSLSANTTGSSNSSFGQRAGRFIADGTTANAVTTNSVYLGSETKALASGQTNQIVIGHSATGLGSNTAVLGNDSIVTTALKGNVGIGTTSPGHKLDVTGAVRITSTAPAAASGQISLGTSGSNNRPILFIGSSGSPSEFTIRNTGKWDIGTTASGGDVSIVANNVEAVRVKTSGNVGIGTTSPDQRLDVVGSIKASQPIIFPSYTVGTLPTGASYTGGMAYVTNEADGSTMAFYDGTNWRRVQDRAVVSAAP
jgi:hypothetical protein